MDIRCKNCGQMIDENDKYCKYCGYLIPQKEEQTKLSKRELDDKIQKEKATVSEDEILGANEWDMSLLQAKKVGDKKSICFRNTIITILSFVVAIALFVGALLIKFLVENDTLGFVFLLLAMLALISVFGLAVEKYFNTKAIKNLQENSIVVRKYGFKKPAEFLLGGYVFEVVLKNEVCPKCEGEIIGDLHIETIENKPVVICNINRKHFWTIDEKTFLENMQQGQVEIVDSTKKKKK